jgi:hypothetical protein
MFGRAQIGFIGNAFLVEREDIATDGHRIQKCHRQIALFPGFQVRQARPVNTGKTAKHAFPEFRMTADPPADGSQGSAVVNRQRRGPVTHRPPSVTMVSTPRPG